MNLYLLVSKHLNEQYVFSNSSCYCMKIIFIGFEKFNQEPNQNMGADFSCSTIKVQINNLLFRDT